MQRAFQILRPSILLVLFTLMLTGGCAPPQPSNDLQQRIDDLLNIQQQQALQLEQLTQQLSGLQVQPSTLLPTTPVQAPQSADSSQFPPPKIASAAETALLSEAAELYLGAFAALATGQMAEAENGFKTFIQRFPNHQYLGNANYWLAESLLAQDKTKEAETLLLRIIDAPNQQPKAPAAMARLVNFYRETNAQDNAAAMLQMLSDNYPESPELKRLMRQTKTR